MKQFLLKISLAFAIVSAVLLAVELYLRAEDDSFLKLKSQYIFDHADDIQGISLGPSHSMRAINPAIFDFPLASLAMSGSALNIDQLLFEKFQNGKELKFVLFDLSQGYLDKSLAESYLRERKLPYYFRIFPKNWELRDYLRLRLPISENLSQQSKKDYRLNQYGFIEKLETGKKEKWDKLPASKNASTVVRKHDHINNENYYANWKIVEKILSTCSEKNLTVIFLSPPKHQSYNSLMPKIHHSRRDSLLRSLGEGKNFHFWNDEELFSNRQELFYNSNHLLPEGAKIYSKNLNERLNAFFDN